MALVALLVIGCRSSSRGLGDDVVGNALAACEAKVPTGAAPGGAEQLDDHLGCLLGVQGSMPTEARVHVALARALHARGLGWPDPIRDDLHSARGWAIKGLILKERFSARLAEERGVLSPLVVKSASAGDQDLLAWGARSWARWLHLRGVQGAAIDLPGVQAMGARAAELAPDSPDTLAAVALVRSIDPQAADDDAIRAAWNAALAADPGSLLNRYDAASFGPLDEREGHLRTIAASAPEGGGMRRFEGELVRRLSIERLASWPDATPED